MARHTSLRFIACASMITLAATVACSQSSQVSVNKALLEQALRDSVLIEGHTPFHLVLEIAPDTSTHSHAHPAPDSMRGTVELFWVDRTRYKLVIATPDFQQTRIVDSTKIEEHDVGDFYPRWLDNFVRALLDPVPQQQLPKLMHQPLGGRARRSPHVSSAFMLPGCLETSDRPGGITEETSAARICFDPEHPWLQGMSDFTRYVTFSDYARFGSQMIPRTWLDDIPENIFVVGKVITLEKLSRVDAATIHATTPTPIAEQIRTVFLSRAEIGARIAKIPPFEWPAEDTEALEGYMIVYVRTDRAGKIREAYWDSSDNYKLQDAGMQLALQSALQPLLAQGAPVQIEGPLVLHFKTHHSHAVVTQPLQAQP